MDNEMQLDALLVKSLREKKGWSQSDLAEVSGLSLRTVQRVESTGNASRETKICLAAAFDVPHETLQHQANISQQKKVPHQNLGLRTPHILCLALACISLVNYFAQLSSALGFIANTGFIALFIYCALDWYLDNHVENRSILKQAVQVGSIFVFIFLLLGAFGDQKMYGVMALTGGIVAAFIFAVCSFYMSKKIKLH